MHIDIEGSRLSLRYPMEVNMVGDSATALRALLPMLTPMASWDQKVLRSWWQTLEERAMDSAAPLNPQRVFWELSPRLPDNAIITRARGDPGIPPSGGVPSVFGAAGMVICMSSVHQEIPWAGHTNYAT